MPSDSSEAMVRTGVDRFLSSARCRHPNTRRAYAGVLDRLAEHVGADRRLAELEGGEVLEALNALWGGAAASTWNQRRAAVASWLAWSAKNGYRVPTMPDAADRRGHQAARHRAPTAMRVTGTPTLPFGLREKEER